MSQRHTGRKIEGLLKRLARSAGARRVDAGIVRKRVGELAALLAGEPDGTFVAQGAGLGAEVGVGPRDVAERLSQLAAAVTADSAVAVAAEVAALVAGLTGGAPPADAPVERAVEQEAPAPVDSGADEELAAYLADRELSGMFVNDAIDHLGTIEAVLLKLDSAPGDVRLLNDLFRPFHTVKGNAGVLGFTSIQSVAHRVETLLDLARSGQHALGQAEIDVVLKAVDLLMVMVQDLPARAEGRPATDCTARRHALLDAVDALIAGGEAPAATAQVAAATTDLAPSVVPAILEEESAAPDVEAPGPVPAPATRQPEPAPHPSTTGAAVEAPATRQTQWDDGQSTVKVNTRKLDSLVDLVGELVIAQSILAEDPALVRAADDRLTRQLAHIKRITSELQRHAMAMRMVPIRQTFQKMARLVRDLSHKSGKAIDLVVSGEETELDRKVVELLTDPLMHMVRNTIDHGVEPSDVRVAGGKTPVAELRLSAYHQAGAIVIEVADDGAGLNTEKILERALAQGLVREDEAVTPSDIHHLIFQPGFSTADKVTEISGRGVGMDVVKRNIEALRGNIDIRTARGEGTVFTLRLPLTLATVDGILLGVGGERFVIPTFAVRESLRPAASQVHTVRGQASLIQLRDRLLPVLHLGEAFRIANARPAPTEGTVVVIEDKGRCAALVVDALLGKQEVVIKSLGDMFQGVRGVAGGAILGDGRIGLILDAGGLLSLLDRAA